MNKSFRKTLAIVLAAVLMLTAFAGCSLLNKESDAKTSTSDEASVDEVATVAVDETVPVTEVPKDPVLAKVYKPTAAYKDGKEVSLDTIFGKGYAEYGDEFSFYEDGTFTKYIGVTANPDSVTGTYKFLSTTEIELTFNNDKTDSVTVITTDVDNNAVEIKMIINDCHVIFEQVK